MNAAIDAALGENFTLIAAWERLRAARAIAKRESAALLPALDAFAEQSLSIGQRGNGGDGGGEAELLLGLEATYELDLWGRIESRVDAERLRASATLADYHTVALNLAAEVARTWYQLVEARLQLSLINDQIETNRKILELLENRFAAGQSQSADVLRQRQLIEATNEQAIIVQSRIDVLLNLLAVLQGQPPQQKPAIPPSELPALPSMPSTGLPGDLVQRRPDVQAAYLLLQSADRELAAAVSEQYPRLVLVASLTTAAETPADMFQQWLASIAGQLVAPLLDGGQRRAEVERASALKRQRLAEYGQAVLDAFREVESALVLERFQAARIENLQKQLSLARQTYQQLRTQYLNGVTDYIAVLTVLDQEQRLQRDLLAGRLALIEFRIALYRALAGGFQTQREQAVEEATAEDVHE